MRKYLAEFVAVFILVFVGAGSVVADAFLSIVRVIESFGFLGVAIAHGLALSLAIAAVGHISGGHVNPAISIAMWVARRLKFADLIGYLVAQLLGAVAAAGLIRWLVPSDALESICCGQLALNEVNVSQGTAFEIILTFFLAFVIWGVAVDAKGPRSLGPFAIGLVLTMVTLVGGPFTGAAVNPARWFGPALITGTWGNALVWTVGPILGALLASLLYETFLLREPANEMMKEGEADEEAAGLIDEMEEEDEAMVRMPPPPSPPPTFAPPPSPYTPPPPPPAAPEGEERDQT